MNVTIFKQNEFKSQNITATKFCDLIPLNHKIAIWEAPAGEVINRSAVETSPNGQVVPERGNDIVWGRILGERCVIKYSTTLPETQNSIGADVDLGIGIFVIGKIKSDVDRRGEGIIPG